MEELVGSHLELVLGARHQVNLDQKNQIQVHHHHCVHQHHHRHQCAHHRRQYFDVTTDAQNIYLAGCNFGRLEIKNDIRDVCSIADFIDSRLSNLDLSIIDFLILFTKFFFACQNHPEVLKNIFYYLKKIVLGHLQKKNGI